MATQRITFVIDAKDKSGPALRDVTRNLRRAARESRTRIRGEMTESFAVARREIGAFGSQLKGTFLNIRTGLAALGAGVALGAITRQTVDFEKGLREISTIIDDVDSQLPIFEQNIRNTAIAFGQTQGSTIKAQYDIISAGFADAGESAKVLEASAKLAVAGVAEIGSTADLTTSVLKGFGLGADQAEHAADLLFLTVRRGKTTIPELAESFGQLGPQARLAGVSLEEMTAATAALTAGGIKTQESIVALNRLMAGLAAPTGEAGQALKDAGIQITEIGEDGREAVLPLLDVLRQFQGLDLATIQEFFPNIRAVKALGTLTENFAEFERDFVEFTGDTAGTLDEAFARASEGAGFSIEQLRATFADLAVEFGRGFVDDLAGGADTLRERLDELRPVVRDVGRQVGEVLSAAIEFFVEWGRSIRNAVIALAALRAAVVTIQIAQQMQAAITATKAAIAAMRTYAATTQGAAVASLGLKAGIAGAALAIGAMIAIPLGKFLGEALFGAEELNAEFERMRDNARDAAAAFETEFANAAGIARDEARRLQSEGIAVVVEQIEAYNRATGEVVTTGEEVERALDGAGIGYRVLGAEVVSVADAARDAALAFTENGDAVAPITDEIRALADETGIAAEVLAGLPVEVRNAVAEAGTETETLRTDLDRLRSSFQSTSQEFETLLASRRSAAGFDTSTSRERLPFEQELADLRRQIAASEEGVALTEKRRLGLIREIKAGIGEATAEIVQQAAEEAQADKQRALRKEREEKEREAAAKRLAEARAKELAQFRENTQRASQIFAAALRERLDEVKAFAGSAEADLAGRAVALNVTFEVAEAGQAQIEDAVGSAVDQSLGSLEAAGEQIGRAVEDGIEFGDLRGRLADVISDAAGEFRRLQSEASESARLARVDLEGVVRALSTSLVEEGRATAEELAAVAAAPPELLDATFRAIAGSTGETFEAVKSRLGGFADTVEDVRSKTAELDRTLLRLSNEGSEQFKTALRDLVGELDDLTLAELRTLRATIDGSDELQRYAADLVDASIVVKELERAQAELADTTARVSRLLGESNLGGSFATAGDRIRGALLVINAQGIPIVQRFTRTLGLLTRPASVFGDEIRRVIGLLDEAGDAGEDAAAEIGEAFRQAGSQLGDAGIFALIRLRREARQTAKQFEEAGVDEETVQGIEEAGARAGEEIRKRILASASDIVAILGRLFADAISQIGARVRDLVRTAGGLAGLEEEEIDEAVERLANSGVEFVKSVAENFGLVTRTFVKSLPEIFDAIVAAIPEVVRVLVNQIPKVATALAEAIPEVIDAFAEAIPELIPVLLEAVTTVLSAVIDKLPDITRAILDAAVAFVQSLGEIVPELIQRLTAAIPEIFDALIEGLPALIRAVIDAIPAIVLALVDAIPRVVTALAEAIPDLVAVVVAELPYLIRTFIALIPDVIIAFAKELPNLIPAIVLLIPEVVVEIIKALPEIIAALVEGIVVDLVLRAPEIVLSVITALLSGIVEVGRRMGQAVLDVLTLGVSKLFRGKGEGKGFFGGGGKGIFRGGGFFDGLERILTAPFRGAGNAIKNLGEAIGNLFKNKKRFGGMAAAAQFGLSMIPGLRNSPVPILAHAGEGILTTAAVSAVGGPQGVDALNRTQVPDAVARRVRRSTRGRDAPTVVNNFAGANLFAREAGRVVDELQYRNLSRGDGKTSKFLNTRFGGVPGQRKG